MSKYDIEEIKSIIESGEPVVILRAKDNLTPAALKAYIEAYKNTSGGPNSRIIWSEFVCDFEENVIRCVSKWRKNNPKKCKMPV